MSDLFPETVVPLKKKWFPACYLHDEFCSDLLDNPNDWIVAVNGKFYLGSTDDSKTPDFEHPLSEGQVVEFVWTATIGNDTVKLGPDGAIQGTATLSINVPTPPEGTNMFLWDGCDPDTQSDSLDSFASILEPGEESDVEFYVWSHDVPFVFQGGAFVPAPSTQPEAT